MSINIGETRGVTKKVDNNGRATLPKPFRKALDINIGDDVSVFLLENGIYIEKEKNNE